MAASLDRERNPESFASESNCNKGKELFEERGSEGMGKLTTEGKGGSFTAGRFNIQRWSYARPKRIAMKKKKEGQREGENMQRITIEILGCRSDPIQIS